MKAAEPTLRRFSINLIWKSLTVGRYIVRVFTLPQEMAKQEFRLFVSSTFRDLQAERDELIKKVLPRIRRECQRRGVGFTEIDLRWGITPEEARTGKVVRICLEEIDRCAPYFIGIIGSRYGWQPTHDDLAKDPEVLHKFPWIAEFIDAERSIVDLEFTYGALHPARASQPSAFFYRRESHPDEEAAERDRLNILAERISHAGLPLTHFSDPSTFGEQVFTDLLSLLERDWPDAKESSPLEAERAMHRSFAHNRTRSYVADPSLLDQLDRFITSDSEPLIIHARSGLGKSSVMAYATDRYAQVHPTDFVVQHFVGAGSGSDAASVMRHIMMEIRERYHLSDEVPTEYDKLRDDLPQWFAKVQEERLVLVIDAVNQLEGISREMNWLPNFIPENIRLLISTTEGAPLDALRTRGWQELELQPLTTYVRQAIIELYLNEYHKTLLDEQILHIAEHPRTESPLFLRTLLEEIRIFGVFEELDKHIDHYLEAGDERELFDRILGRFERDHGEATVRAVMTAIWAARFGIAEAELLSFTGLTRLALSQFLLSLDYHLMQRDGLLAFFHDHLREAVRVRYLNDEATRAKAHALLGENFSQYEYNARRRDEEAWQWRAAGDIHRLTQALSDVNLVDTILNGPRKYDLLELIGAVPDEARAQIFKPIGPLMVHADHPDIEFWQRLDTLVNFFSVTNQYTRVLELEPYVMQGATPELHDNIGITLKVLSEYSTCLLNLGKSAEALPILEFILSRTEFGEDPAKLEGETLDQLMFLHYQRGEFTQSEEFAKRAVEAKSRLFGKLSPLTAESLNNLGTLLTQSNRIDEAIGVFERAVEILRKTLGSSHPTTADVTKNLAQAHAKMKNHLEARSIYKELLDLELRTFGGNNLRVAETRNQLGSIQLHLKELSEAADNFLKCSEIRERQLGEAHAFTAISYINLAGAKAELGLKHEALELFEKFLPIKAKSMGASHPSVLRSIDSYNSLKSLMPTV